MSNKIPCGGFYLDDMLNVNESGELSIKGGTPYQQLVTDGNGNTKWEDRLAYDDSKLVVESGKGFQYVKVSDEVPSWASVDSPIKLWLSTGYDITGNPGDYVDSGNGSFLFAQGFAAFILTDNTLISAGHYNALFPKKGVYFASVPDNFYTTGIASADSATPEITWDGNVGMLKTIDPKYIPSELNEIIVPSSTPSSTKKFKITVNDTGTISATAVT